MLYIVRTGFKIVEPLYLPLLLEYASTENQSVVLIYAYIYIYSLGFFMWFVSCAWFQGQVGITFVV
jgi:uncharacterized membrane protein